MIVTKHFHPVVNTTHHQFRGEDVRHGSIGECDVSLGAVLDVVVTSPQETFIAETRQPGDLVSARAHGRGTNGFSIARNALNPLQIQRRTQRMATLAHQGPAAGEFPLAIVRRMRPSVRLLPQNAQNLSAALFDDLPLLLNDRSINPILRVTHTLTSSFRSFLNAGTACRGNSQHLLLGKTARAKVSGEGFFNNDVLSQS